MANVAKGLKVSDMLCVAMICLKIIWRVYSCLGWGILGIEEVFPILTGFNTLKIILIIFYASVAFLPSK